MARVECFQVQNRIKSQKLVSYALFRAMTTMTYLSTGWLVFGYHHAQLSCPWGRRGVEWGCFKLPRSKHVGHSKACYIAWCLMNLTRLRWGWSVVPSLLSSRWHHCFPWRPQDVQNEWMDGVVVAKGPFFLFRLARRRAVDLWVLGAWVEYSSW